MAYRGGTSRGKNKITEITYDRDVFAVYVSVTLGLFVFSPDDERQQQTYNAQTELNGRYDDVRPNAVRCILDEFPVCNKHETKTNKPASVS